LPQAPQLVASLQKSTQPSSQQAGTTPGSESGHVAPPGQPQIPRSHTVPSPAQGEPHSPQWASSLRVSTQRPWQQLSPSWHARVPHTHRPSTQAVPSPQRTPQAPQWFALVARFTHPAVPQHWSAGPHAGWDPQRQLPSTQLSAVSKSQAKPQPPQWPKSESTMRHE
jgi:hypothetical protein